MTEYRTGQVPTGQHRDDATQVQPAFVHLADSTGERATDALHPSRVFTAVPTDHYGIRIDTRNGLRYIGKRLDVATFEKYRDNLLSSLMHPGESDVYTLAVEEGIICIMLREISAVSFFSYEWLDQVQPGWSSERKTGMRGQYR